MEFSLIRLVLLVYTCSASSLLSFVLFSCHVLLFFYIPLQLSNVIALFVVSVVQAFIVLHPYPFTRCLLIASGIGGVGFAEGDDDDDVVNPGIMLADLGKDSSSSPAYLVGKLITNKSHNLYALIDVMTKAFHPKSKLTARV